LVEYLGTLILIIQATSPKFGSQVVSPEVPAAAETLQFKSRHLDY